MKHVWLGNDQDYQHTLNHQFELIQQRRDDQIGDTLLLLEHSSVYTIGRTRDQSSLQGAQHLPHPVVEISRGGQATFHGPGQLVGYPILDLTNYGRDLHAYMRAIEEALIQTCKYYKINASRQEGMTGVWVENRKLASIGVGVRKWTSYHGFAINVEEISLPPFQFITPCGLDGVSMTCVNTEANVQIKTRDFAKQFVPRFETELEMLRSKS